MAGLCTVENYRLIAAKPMHHFLDILLNGPARYTERHHLSPLWSLVVVLAALFGECSLAYALTAAVFKAIRHSRSGTAWLLRCCGVGKRAVHYSFLQLTFPADTTKSAFATEQLHILLRNLAGHTGLLERLAGRKRPYSLELAATKDAGIRYIIRVPTEKAEVVRSNLLSFLPGLKVVTIGDYLADLTHMKVGVVELRLGSDFVLPLKDHRALDEHDPIAYLTGHMRSLAAEELVAFQIVTAPVFRETHYGILRRIRDIEHRIALGKELSTQLTSNRIHVSRLALRAIWIPLLVAAKCVTIFGGVVAIFLSNGHDLPDVLKTNRDKRRSDDPYELELGRIIKGKLDQQLFEVTMRILVAASDEGAITGRLEAMVSSFGTFTSPYQAIRARGVTVVFPSSKKDWPRFSARELSPHLFSWPTIVSSSELSDLYHFPNTDTTKTEDLVKSRSRELPAPLSQKSTSAAFDVIVGENSFGNNRTPVGQTLAQRQRHTYVIGKTGTGKTTLLKNAIYQDMVNGKGFAVLDPHGDMFRELLRIVPEHRQKDVVVFDPSDREYPLGLNILDPGVPFDSVEDRDDWITSTVLAVFAKLTDANLWGPRMEHILRSTVLTALQTPNPSLYTVQRLLTDKKYRREVARTLEDPVLKQFWDKEFKLLGTMQLASATAPLTHRLGHFITSKMSRHILLQETSTLRIADIMNEGKILLVNLSKGDIGEDQSFFFGTILTSLMWMAAYQRTKIPEPQRRDFFIYVDEFQNFATPRFSEITSEGRKFHISLVVSHQNIAQVEDKNILKIVAGNAATIICLKASPEDEDFILPFMKPEVTRGDIVNLTPFHFYMKVTSDEAEDAFSGHTLPLSVAGSHKIGQAVRAMSRECYGTPKAVVEGYVETLFGGFGSAKKSDVKQSDGGVSKGERKLERI